MTQTERIANHVYDRHVNQIAPYPHAHVLDQAPGMFRTWREVARFGLQMVVLCLTAWGLVCLVLLF